MNAERTSQLRAEGLTIGYPSRGGENRIVASGLDLNLRRGEFVCLLGPNGVGKSTLIRAMAGMGKPIDGCIEIKGTNILDLSPKERARAVSVVLTESIGLGMFTGRSIVSLGRHPHTSWTGGLSRNDHERIDWALSTVSADRLGDRQVAELSDGERQKIMIARALAQDCSIMLLDEPTAFLDLPRRVELMRTLRELSREEGLSIALSTHDLDLAMRSADSLWLLSEGGRLTCGAPEDLALRGELQAAFSSESLDWDEEQGSFKLHREPCAYAGLKGSGPEYAWTRRALRRIGYGIAGVEDEVKIRIRIREKLDGTVWEIEREGATVEAESLGEVIEALTMGADDG